MEQTAKAREGKPGPKPRGPYHYKRKTLTTRVTEGTRQRIEGDAVASGRSLAQEVELQLERSPSAAVLGSKETYGLLRLLAAAAEIIEAKTGKSWSSDWDTFQAVQAAWRKLIPAAGPKPPPGLVDVLTMPAPSIPIPPVLPIPPVPILPSPLARTLAPGLVPDPDKEQKAYEKKCATYKRDVAKCKKNEKIYEEYRLEMKQARQYIEELLGIGENVAADLFKVMKQR